jgi:hypothetical protein
VHQALRIVRSAALENGPPGLTCGFDSWRGVTAKDARNIVCVLRAYVSPAVGNGDDERLIRNRVSLGRGMLWIRATCQRLWGSKL